MTITKFSELPLAESLQQALISQGYTDPSPIQAQAIPVLLAGRDLLACAQTGTGKTAAFALPVLDKFARQKTNGKFGGLRCLILLPTRELAVQVADSFATYGQNLNVKVGMVFGGVSERPQINSLRNGVDVLVATTGRLLDLYQQGYVDLSKVDTFILDEADRMLDMGFIRDIRKIAEFLPKKRQTLLFSATMAPDVTKLAASLLNKPEEIRIAPQGTTAEKIDQYVFFTQKKNKQDLLLDLIGKHVADYPNELSLVFSRTKHGARKLAEKLMKAGIEADAIHGNKSQAARQKTLDRYRQGRTPVLVATDVAARGIDVKNITLVINFDLPMEADSYVHRIGRTARAGESGRAVSFCCDDEIELLRSVERLIKRTIPIDDSHRYHAQELVDLHKSGVKTKTVDPRQGNRSGGGNRNFKRGGNSPRGGSAPRSGGGGKPFSSGGRSFGKRNSKRAAPRGK